MVQMAFLSLALILAMAVPAFAGPSAHSFIFVGTAAQCAPFPKGANIVQGDWLKGIGLPDNQGGNNDPANDANLRYGLLLVKNGLTSNCSSAGANFGSFGPFVTDAGTELGYDYISEASHCGAGAPRFNISWKLGTSTGFSFLGCSAGTFSPAPQDPANWTRQRSNVGTAFPPVPVGATITALSLLFDEGTDQGTGLAILDNIFLNGKIFVNENQFVTPLVLD